ncbi:universal stress protein, partial [Streptomyces werraensis]|uniref:universal stress protein n=1 Tax=Streptomyces werraensis TaxID=68284 RepID=UPI00343F5DF4
MDDQPVVAAVDGSTDGLRALEWALDAARRHRATLRVLHVHLLPREFGLFLPQTEPVVGAAQRARSPPGVA